MEDTSGVDFSLHYRISSHKFTLDSSRVLSFGPSITASRCQGLGSFQNSESTASGKNDAMETIETSNRRFEVTTPGSPRLKVPKRDFGRASPAHSVAGETPVAVHHLILDCSTWAYIDSVGIRVLKEVGASLWESIPSS